MAVALDALLGSTGPSGGATSVSYTTTAAVAAGAHIVAVVGWFSGTATLGAVTVGSVTLAIDKQITNGQVNMAICSARAPSGVASGATANANFSTSTGGRGMGAASFSGLQTSPLDATGSATPAAGTAWNSGAVAASSTAGLVVGAAVSDETSATTTSTPAAGWTEALDFNNGTNGDTWTLVYQLNTGGGTFTPSGTWAAVGTNTNTGLSASYLAPAAPAATPFMPHAMPLA